MTPTVMCIDNLEIDRFMGARFADTHTHITHILAHICAQGRALDASLLRRVRAPSVTFEHVLHHDFRPAHRHAGLPDSPAVSGMLVSTPSM